MLRGLDVSVQSRYSVLGLPMPLLADIAAMKTTIQNDICQVPRKLWLYTLLF